ncbi:MAG: mobile mystery protein A [Angustibacter sp.]
MNSATESVEAHTQAWRSLPSEVRSRPQGGWVRAIRQALGMSCAELADRVGVTTAAISKLERNERHRTISLPALERAAEALNCDVVYALVPRASIHDTIHDQAARKAREIFPRIAHTMALENQSLTRESAQRAFEDLVAELAQRRGLWDDPK